MSIYEMRTILLAFLISISQQNSFADEYDYEDEDEAPIASRSHGTNTTNATNSAGQADFLQKVENYLNGIKTLKANYSQSASQARSIVNGTFYLKRSTSGYGQMRLEDKTQRLISNGSDLIHTDLMTQESNSYPISSTPAAFLLDSHIDFSDYTIKQFTLTNNGAKITFVRKGDEENYTLTMGFKTSPFLIIDSWIIKDGQGNLTNVSLSNVQIGVNIADSLFQ